MMWLWLMLSMMLQSCSKYGWIPACKRHAALIDFSHMGWVDSVKKCCSENIQNTYREHSTHRFAAISNMFLTECNFLTMSCLSSRSRLQNEDTANRWYQSTDTDMVRQWHGAPQWDALCTRLTKCYQILHSSSSDRGDIIHCQICSNYHSSQLYKSPCLRQETTLRSYLCIFLEIVVFYQLEGNFNLIVLNFTCIFTFNYLQAI